jgi:hypothetical protein
VYGRIKKERRIWLKWSTIFSVVTVLGACATDPVYTVPADESVADYIVAIQLDDTALIRKGNHDSWQYLNDHYIIYRGRNNFLVEFRQNCAGLTDSSFLPADYIHDHRNLRAGEDTIRGCIVEKIYPITNDQRNELRHLGEAPGQRN